MDACSSHMDEADIYSLYASRTPDCATDLPAFLSPPTSDPIPSPKTTDGGGRYMRPSRLRDTLKPFEQYTPQPFEDQFCAPVLLDRRRSAKELINCFEAMVTTEPLAHVSTPPRPSGLEIPASKVEKKTSPLRLSLRNIMSVFKKSRKSLRERGGELSIYLQPTVEDREAPEKSPGSTCCTSPVYAIHSGTVLYLQRPDSTSNILPVWSKYQCTLHSTHILLSATTTSADGLSASRVLSLTGCDDVHSVPLRSLSAEEQALMPIMDEAWSPSVFDIIFNDKPSERFAVATAKERSAWVSAMWEAALRANVKGSYVDKEPSVRPILNVDTSITSSTLIARDARLQRDLPSIPPTEPDTLRNNSPAKTELHSPVTRPFSRQHLASPNSPATITQRLSALSEPTSSFKVHSPSVLNLSQKSVVKQRLAEMEKQTSSSSSSPSPTANSRFTTPTTSPLRTAQTSLSSSRPPSHNACGSSPYALQIERSSSPVSSRHSIHSAIASPTSSVFSRSKSAFRIRDELRQERRSGGMAPTTAGGLDSFITGGRKVVGVDMIEHIEAVGEDVKLIRADISEVAQRGQQDSKELEKLSRTVGEIKKAVLKNQEDIVLKNEKPGGMGDGEDASSTVLRQIIDKLETIGVTSNNTEIMAFLQEDRVLRGVQHEQQADSARYLNELNVWLDTFAKNNAAHVESIGDAVQRLCREFGSSSIMEDGTPDGAQPPTLLYSIRQLVAQGQAREQENIDLRQGLNQLMSLLSEDMRLNAEMRSAYTTESVMSFMDRQKQDLEQMVQVLETRLAEEIRGSRLRFVEAMKEATEINVKGHVEELKRTMMRETAHQTREAARAQKRRQALDQEVAQMLALRANLMETSRPASANDMIPATAAPKPERARSARPAENMKALSPIQERPHSAISYRSNASTPKTRALPTPPPGGQAYRY